MIEEIFSPSQAAFRATEDFFVIHESESAVKQKGKIVFKAGADILIATAAIVETIFFAILTGAFSLFYLVSPEHFDALKNRTIAALFVFKNAFTGVFTPPRLNKNIPSPSESPRKPIENRSHPTIEPVDQKLSKTKTWSEALAAYYLGIKNQINYFTKKGS